MDQVSYIDTLFYKTLPPALDDVVIFNRPLIILQTNVHLQTVFTSLFIRFPDIGGKAQNEIEER